MSFRLRAATPADLEPLYEMAKLTGGGFTNLPADRNSLAGKLARAEAAWANHLRLVRRSLERGYNQGWDLHPAQLPTRFAATFGFYRDGLATATARLRTYDEHRDSGVLDEPATARALADFRLRGLDCGALSGAEVTEATGLDTDALAGLAHRTGGHADGEGG